MSERRRLKFGFPIGAIQDETVEFFKKAGYSVRLNLEVEKIEINDPEIECVPLRPIPMVSFVQKGDLDAGISTQASLIESGAKVKEVLVLEDDKSILEKTRIVLAVSKDSKIKKPRDLQGKKIITKIPNIAKEYLKKNRIKAEIIFSDMLFNESKVGTIADAMIEFVKSGETIRAYNLKILETILESSSVLIANEKALKNEWKKNKIENLANVLKGAVNAKVNEILFKGIRGGEIDDIDFKIIQILSQKGRETFSEIAKEVGLSSVGVKERVEKLIKKGILEIKGFLNPESFYSISAQIRVRASRETTSWLIKKLKNSSLVYHLVKVSGKYNLIIGAMAQNIDVLNDFISKEIEAEPGVKSIEVNIGELPIIPKVWAPLN
jgi:ATP phosphoribosyltransferase